MSVSDAITIKAVTKRFGDFAAVDNIDLSIPKGEFFSLLGPSGCGKTTTLRMLAGFEVPTEGHILLEGEPVEDVPPYERNVNMVFQSYALFGHLDVAGNVAFGLKRKKRPKDEIEQRVADALELVGLADRAHDRPNKLSGGQRQRVALARALVNRPSVLLLDEPLGALDLKLRRQMQVELKQIQREVGITFVYVTHDQEEALTMSDVIVVMRDGRIQQSGDPTELYERPVNRFVAAFIGTSNFLGATIKSVGGSGHVGVETDRGLALNGVLTDAAATVAVGDPVTIAVRPERLEISAGTSDSQETGWSAIPGRIQQGTYLGDQTEFRIQTDLAGELVVRRQNATGAQASLGLGPGDPVTVRWQEEANLVLAG
jgi:spermidine/putrescine transport system ATP-binding protein